MPSTFKYVAGIDISKKTFDISLSNNDFTSEVKYRLFANTTKGFNQLRKWLKTFDLRISEVLFCMENTGIYHRLLASFLESEQAFVWIENGREIKWSMGIQRGKTDKVDSERILEYAKRNLDKAKTNVSKSEDLQQITDLLAVRKRIISCIKILKVPAKELNSAGLKEQAKLVEKATRKSLRSLEAEKQNAEDSIKKIIRANENLHEIYIYVTSVKSVGFVAAVYLLVYTNGFTKFDSAKQIASYCGIAPFEYSSGTSVKGRTRVHHLANKNLKTILHMCAISALANNEEMKIYFKRKVDEGKNKMLVINSVRNKILSRIFSCVKNKKIYKPYLAA